MLTHLSRTGRLLALASALTLAAACGGDGDGGGGPNNNQTTFTGILSSDDGQSSGAVEFVAETGSPAPPAGAAALVAPVNITGTVTFGGTFTVTGTYDPATGDLTASGGGFSFTGTYDGNGGLTGTWTGPGGLSGTFVATSGNAPAVFCGTYDEDDDGSINGTFSFFITGSSITGEAYPQSGGGVIPLGGTANGNGNLTITTQGQTIATGTRNGTDVSGDYDTGSSSGTWVGSACQ